MRFLGLTVLDLILYCLAALALLLRFAGLGPAFVRERRGFAVSAAVAAVALHALALYALIFTARGLDLGFFNSVTLVGWLLALIACLMLVKPRFGNLSIVLFPLAGVSAVLAEAFPRDQLVVLDTDWPLDAHIVLSLVAYSLLAVAALQALALAVQDHRLRRRQPGGLWTALPPLEIMERFLFQLLTAGFVLLTLALFTGLIFVKNIFEQHLVHKTVLSLLAWLVFAILLWGRWKFGWRGRTAIRWTLSGFVVLMLAYFGSKLVLELILGRHWGLMS